jgi:aromatic ring-opening dioxygenase catalytic subunit (LigB family)
MWAKTKLTRRSFCRALGASALTFCCGQAIAKGKLELETIKTKIMPVFYIPHGGGPCFFMEWTMGPRDTWDGMAAWLKQLGSTVPERPQAIVVISAHWEESAVAINTAARPDLLYDYYGFPAHTYEIKYPAPGSPSLARRVDTLLAEAGIKTVNNSRRGLDHGVFVPLKLVYPQADIPVVQVSLHQNLSPSYHLAIGKALAPLRHEGVLIIGSGMSYHNLRRFGPEGKSAAAGFDQWLNDAVCHRDPQKRNQLLEDWQNAPSAREAHPREEHLIPLMVIAGAAGADQGKRNYSQLVNGLAISAFSFG